MRTESLTAGPLLFELPLSVRAHALGNSFAAAYDDSDAVFYSPALIEDGGFTVGIHRFGANASLLTASGSGSWWGGSVALGMATLDHGVERDRPQSLLRDPASLFYLGPVAASTSMATLGYARSYMGLRWGITGKYVSQRIGSSRATTAAADLGVAFNFGVGNVALSVQNLGQGLDLAETTLDLAQRTLVTVGTARRPTGPIDLGVNAHLGRDGSGEILAGGGLEIAYWPVQGRTFIARIGAATPGETSSSAMTFGGGFSGDQFQVDYSYGGFETVDGVHRFSVSFR